MKPLLAGRLCAQIVLGIKEKKGRKNRFGFVGCGDDVRVVLCSCRTKALKKRGRIENIN